MRHRSVEEFVRDPGPMTAAVEAGEMILLTREGVPVLRLEPAHVVLPDTDD